MNFPIYKKIIKDLKDNSDKKFQESQKKFFKEKIKLYGVKTAIVHKIAKKYFPKI